MSKETTKQETGEAILDAAERLLARYGYNKMTMSDLAEEAGIGVGTTYLHFPGKAEVALAVVDRSHERVIEKLRETACSAAPPPHRLREMLQMRVLLRYEAVRNRSHQIEELKNAMRQQMLIQQCRRRWFDVEMILFGKVLQEGRDQKIFELDDALNTAETLLWAMDALMPRNLKAQDYEDPEAFADKAQRIVEMLLRSLRPLSPEEFAL